MTGRLFLTFRVFLTLTLCLAGYASEAELLRAFAGKPVRLKIDMPGSHNGVNLHLDRDEPMDWREYSDRVRRFGVSISKGQTATVTLVVVKKDLIEFHLDGGGFGTFGDDTSTSVSTYVPKSSYESSLERDLRKETDPARRRRIRSSLDRERDRRRREESRLRLASEGLNEEKRRRVMENRLRGGSRFNLRGIPGALDVLPNQLAEWLAAYVEFDGAPPAQRSATPAPVARPVTRVAQPQPAVREPEPTLRRGMSLEEVRRMYGPGRLDSESVGADGTATQHWTFPSPEGKVKITSVESIVVKYEVIVVP